MLAIRELIFDVAAKTDGVGELLETLKWGEPAYVTAKSKSGSTVRIDWKARTPEQCAVYFNCNTGLVDAFKMMFAEDFSFEGRRAIVFKVDDKIPRDALAFCIRASLTHHANKRANASAHRRVKTAAITKPRAKHD